DERPGGGSGVQPVDRRAPVQTAHRARARQPAAARVGPAPRRSVPAEARDLRRPRARLPRATGRARGPARAGRRAPEARAPALASFREVKSFRLPHAVLEVRREDAPATSARLLAALPVADLSIEDPPIEEVIRLAFARGVEEDE